MNPIIEDFLEKIMSSRFLSVMIPRVIDAIDMVAKSEIVSLVY